VNDSAAAPDAALSCQRSGVATSALERDLRAAVDGGRIPRHPSSSVHLACAWSKRRGARRVYTPGM
jgi:hypothetical protein